MVDGAAAGCRQGSSRQWCHGSRSSHAGGWWSGPSHGWGRFRRLSKDYEFLPATSEAVIQLTMIQLLTRRLASK